MFLEGHRFAVTPKPSPFSYRPPQARSYTPPTVLYDHTKSDFLKDDVHDLDIKAFIRKSCAVVSTNHVKLYLELFTLVRFLSSCLSSKLIHQDF